LDRAVEASERAKLIEAKVIENTKEDLLIQSNVIWRTIRFVLNQYSDVGAIIN
jgi:hypothetical protein